jgi:hypothetical protein
VIDPRPIKRWVKVADRTLAELQSKAQPVEPRGVAVTEPHHKPKPPTSVPCDVTERLGPSISPEPNATAAATAVSATNATAPTDSTTADKSTSRCANSEHIPATDATNAGSVSCERNGSGCTSHAVSGTDKRIGCATSNTSSTGACITRRPVGVARLDSSDKELGPGFKLTVGRYGLRDDGSGYATTRVKTLCVGLIDPLTNVLFVETCIRRSSPLGRILRPLTQWNPTSTYRVAIMSRPLHPVRRRHRASRMRHCSICSIRVHETLSRRSLPKSCTFK